MTLKKTFGLIAAILFAVVFALCGYGNAMALINGLGSLGEFSLDTILWLVMEVAVTALCIWGIVYVILTIVKLCQKKLDEDATAKSAKKSAFIADIMLVVASAGWLILYLLGRSFVWQFFLVVCLAAAAVTLFRKNGKVSYIVGLCFLLIFTLFSLLYARGAIAELITQASFSKIVFIVLLVAIIAECVIAFLPETKKAAEEPAETPAE